MGMGGGWGERGPHVTSSSKVEKRWSTMRAACWCHCFGSFVQASSESSSFYKFAPSCCTSAWSQCQVDLCVSPEGLKRGHVMHGLGRIKALPKVLVVACALYSITPDNDL